MNLPRISVIIPVHNRHDWLASLLAQLDQQQHPHFEVVLIDDGSTPSIEKHLSDKNYRFPWKIVRLLPSRGAGAARNRGLENATNELIVFIDSDGIVDDPEWLIKHARYHAAAGNISSKLPFVLHSHVKGIHHTYAGRTFYYSNWFMSCSATPYIARDHHFPTHNTSVPRRLFDLVGCFDETLEVAEDAAWCMKALDAGVELRYDPGMPAGHRDRETMGEIRSSYLRMGRFAGILRRRRKDSPHGFLYPKRRWQGPIYFFPLTILMTAYIVMRWLRTDPTVVFYLPGLYYVNVMYYLGLISGLEN